MRGLNIDKYRHLQPCFVQRAIYKAPTSHHGLHKCSTTTQIVERQIQLIKLIHYVYTQAGHHSSPNIYATLDMSWGFGDRHPILHLRIRHVTSHHLPRSDQGQRNTSDYKLSTCLGDSEPAKINRIRLWCDCDWSDDRSRRVSTVNLCPVSMYGMHVLHCSTSICPATSPRMK